MFVLQCTFTEKYMCRFFQNTIRESYSLDPDQARQNVGFNLGPNCLQRLSGAITYHICFTFSVKCMCRFFQNTIRESNSLDPDQDRQNVGPDQDPNLLQKFSWL